MAPYATANEVLPLLRRARQVNADELSLLKDIPAEHITSEVRAFLLASPDPEVWLQQITTIPPGSRFR